jgi:hypothetical protein
LPSAIVIATDRGGPGRAVMESLGTAGLAVAVASQHADFTFHPAKDCACDLILW